METHPQATANAGHAPEHRPMILLAEDDDDQRAGLTAFLETLGYDVLAVADGSEMLEALARVGEAGEAGEAGAVRPDLIISDIMMPGMTGLGVVEELRAAGWSEPIIIISGFEWPERQERIGRLDKVELLVKPYDPTKLARLLREMLPTTPR